MKDKEQDFVRLAEKRVRNAIRSIRLVRNLSNKSNYSYTDRDANRISRALQDEVRGLRQAFRTGGKKVKNEFKLR